MSPRNKYTKEQLSKIVSESSSIAQVLRAMNLKIAGGNYANLQRKLDKLQIDTSHMSGQAHNKGKQLIPFGELIKPGSIKKCLIKSRGRKCEDCFGIIWRGQPIPLELEHIDGNNRNNHNDNLKLLCPNCHALTPTWRNRKR